jgi:dynein heavy chain
LTNKAENLFQTLLRLDIGTAVGSAVEESLHSLNTLTSTIAATTTATTTSSLREILVDLLKKCPAQFSLIDLSDRSKQRLLDADGPYTVVLIQECTRLNVLLLEIASSLDELQKGLNGQLNMSQGMEDMVECLETNQVPGRNPFHACSWERLAWPSRKNLASWFNDLLLRKTQLNEWCKSLSLPYSVWLPGLMNPTALLTAIKQVFFKKK